MNRNKIKLIKVGAFVGAALIIFVVFIFSLGGDQTFSGKARYVIKFESTTGLYEGDPVLLTGVEVGTVDKIRFSDSLDEVKILVEISVDKNVAKRIRQDSRAKISSASIVYGKIVALTSGSSAYPQIPEGGTIEVEGGMGLSAMVDTTSMVIEDLRSIVGKIDRGDGLLGLMLNEPMGMKQTLNNLSDASKTMSCILDRIDKGEGALGDMVKDSSGFHQSLKDFTQAAKDLKEVADHLKGKETLLGKLINDKAYGDKVSKDLASTLHSLANITAKIDSGDGAAASFLNDNSVYEGLQHVVLGMEKSSMTKWMIQNRRKAGEKAELKEEERLRDESASDSE